MVLFRLRPHKTRGELALFEANVQIYKLLNLTD